MVQSMQIWGSHVIRSGYLSLQEGWAVIEQPVGLHGSYVALRLLPCTAAAIGLAPNMEDLVFISIFSLIILAVTALARGERVNLPALLQPMGRALASVQSYQMVSESSMPAGPGQGIGPTFRMEITFVRHGKDVRIRTLVLFSSNYYETVTRGTRSCQRRGPTARWQCPTAPRPLPAAS